MESQKYQKDLYPEALKMFKARITKMEKIRELLRQQNPDSSEDAIDDAMTRLKGYRFSTAKRSLLIEAVLTPLGILAVIFLMGKGGIIEMALIGALLGGGIGLLIQGAKEYSAMK